MFSAIGDLQLLVLSEKEGLISFRCGSAPKAFSAAHEGQGLPLAEPLPGG